MNRFFLVLITFVQLACASRSSIVVFPLVNSSNDKLHEWVSAAVCEMYSRKLSNVDGIRVWDPVFMFQTDSSGWKLVSDSLVTAHSVRWMWDAAAGGKFSVRNDTVDIDLKIVWMTGNKQHVVMKLDKSGSLGKLPGMIDEMIISTCKLLKIDLSSSDSLAIISPDHIRKEALFTYWCGYGLEMNRKFSEAQSAYDQVAILDKTCLMALYRAGRLYLKSGNLNSARDKFTVLLKHGSPTNASSAALAEYSIENDPPSKTLRFIKKNQKALEGSAAGLTVMGNYYLTIGEYQRAIALLRRAIAWGPSDLDAEFLLAMGYFWSGEYNAALELFNRLISMRPNYLRYHVSIGAVYRKAGRQMEAFSVLESARKKEPDNTMVLTELAHTCFSLGWYRKSGQLLELAHRLKPDQSEILIDMGIVYWHEKRFSESEECFRNAEYAGNKNAVLVNAGNMSLETGNFKKAVLLYRAAGKAGSRNPEVLYNLAFASMKMGNSKAAARYLDELIQLTPGRIDLLVIRAHLAQKLGKNADAVMAYHKILENDPYHDIAVEGLVRLLLSEKKYEEAIYRIESYLEVKPARGDFMVLLAEAYREREWFEVAIVKYELVTRTFPDYPAGYLGMGRCYYSMFAGKKSKQYDEALYVLKQASAKAPANPDPDELMGDIYHDYKGYKDLAIEHWRKAYDKTVDLTKKKAIMRKLAEAGRS